MMRRRASPSSAGHHDSGSTLDYGYGDAAAQQHAGQMSSPMSVASGAASPYDSPYASSPGGYGYGTPNGSGHGGMPTYYGDNANGKRKSFRGGHGGSGGAFASLLSHAKLILTVGLTIFFLTTVHYRSKYVNHLSDHDTASSDLEATITHLREEKAAMQTELKQARDRKKRLEEKVAELTTKVHAVKKEKDTHKETHQEASKKASKREKVLQQRLDWFAYTVGREGHRSVVEKFGEGPYQVSIQVELPADPSNYPTMPANPSFVVNLNPLDKTPHSVWLFLEQVSYGLWDATSFVVNAPHILQVGTHVTDADGKSRNKIEDFEYYELDGLSFQEYHEDHPHSQYSLGFAGRPHGGPDWYINKIDNSKAHGPGGQQDAILHEEADPTFATVDSGSMDVVHRLFALPTENKEGSHVIARPVRIIRATVVGWTDPKAAAAAQEKAAAAPERAAAPVENAGNAQADAANQS